MITIRRRLSFLRSLAGFVAVTAFGSSGAVTVNANGTIDLNNDGLPRLQTDACRPNSAVAATGTSNFPANWRLLRNGETVASASGVSSFAVNSPDNFAFQPGAYVLRVVSTRSDRELRAILNVDCQ